MRPLELLATRLPGVDTTRTQQDVPCPAHSDARSSLSVGVRPDGSLLLHCHAGCSLDQVLAAVGLGRRDLFPSNGSAMPPPVLSRSAPTLAALAGWGGPTLDDAVKVCGIELDARETARYPYRDATGKVCFVVVRYEPRGGDGKIIRPFRMTERGCIPGGYDGVRPLYRLPELLVSPGTVYVVEGEKCVERARSIGLTATTSAHGAGSAARTDWSTLAGREVVFLPDNDDAGRGYVNEAVGILAGLPQPPKSVRIVNLPGLPEHGDIADLVEARAGGGPALRAEIERLTAEAAPIALEDRRSRLEIVSVADVREEPIDWLWEGRIAKGKVSMIVGDPGLGKSFLTVDLAARVSTGRPWPDQPGQAREPASVILFNAEDDLGDTIKPRLLAAGADVTRIHAIATVRRVDRGHEHEGTFSLETDLPLLEDALRSRPDVRLIVIDPISACMGAADTHNNAEVRGVLAPLAALASRYRVAVVVVSHLNKTSGGSIIYRTMGSLAFTAAARAVLGVTRDKTNKDRRLLLPIKNNIGPDASGLAYILHAPASDAVPHLAWDPEPVTTSAEEAFAPEREGGRTERDEAGDWLRETLSAGPVPANDVFRRAGEEGFSPATIKRAARAVGIVKGRAGFQGPSVWSLSADGQAGECERGE